MLLAVDTSTAQVGLAVYDGLQGQVIGEYAWRSSQRHTVELAPAVSELLARCELTMEDVRALGVALGPGSFTSLRVGLSLVKGLAFARQLPLIGIPTLDILAAAQAKSRRPLIVAIQAGRGRLAAGWYKPSRNGWQAKGMARVMTVTTLIDEVKAPVVVCAELTAEERQVLVGKAEIQLASPAQSVRRPAVLAELAWKRWQAGDTDEAATLAPIYLHVAKPIPA
ncbi:MAG TPA: tRNA (adenosine(37)-N6)-threonylcarbamoyltransferase complex dimerization subunit type 1 TsaB [Anaerolineales bacterium]